MNSYSNVILQKSNISKSRLVIHIKIKKIASKSQDMQDLANSQNLIA
ncbi:4066_t:CDS:2 [Gigaspora margarita]|uniref:4066_t:CDS:1 n=1 Tax=Gigaspora margarita TaxID=4874 RepID=A0ABN7ULS0_GIGMA|nr:4066_t:CDS:2 [Gigaspora margarita]